MRSRPSLCYALQLSCQRITIPPPDQRILLAMGAGIMASLGGGFTSEKVAELAAGAQKGIVYGRTRVGVTWQNAWQAVTGGRYGTTLPMGDSEPGDMRVTFQGASIPEVSQDIADALESGVFGPLTGPIKVLPEEPAHRFRGGSILASILFKEKNVAAQKAAQVRSVRFVTGRPALVACNY